MSPLSAAMALGMTYNGAAGSTQQAMQAALGLQGMSLEEVNQSYRDLIDLLRNLDPRVEFIPANSIWHRNTMTVKQPFPDLASQFFDAEVAAPGRELGLKRSHSASDSKLGKDTFDKAIPGLRRALPPRLPRVVAAR